MLHRVMKFLLRPVASPPIEAVYRACVTQARLPLFYAELHVPDTVEGRFDLLILHVLLVIRRLRDHTKETQELFDILFADMDKNLREMGVSDMRIGKKMKPLLEAFYGRAKIYEQALATDDSQLTDALQRNIYGASSPSPVIIKRLANYARRANEELAAQNIDDILAGKLNFSLEI
jgi:cytochrome b pre-mRNA-processing protein 3